MGPSYSVVNVAATQNCGKEIVKVNAVDVVYPRIVGSGAVGLAYTDIFNITSSIPACPINKLYYKTEPDAVSTAGAGSAQLSVDKNVASS